MFVISSTIARILIHISEAKVAAVLFASGKWASGEVDFAIWVV